jgi:hypothetical protein
MPRTEKEVEVELLNAISVAISSLENLKPGGSASEVS